MAEQVGAVPDAMDEYVEEERSRQRHAIECQDHLALRPFGRRAAAELLDALLPHAIENDRLLTLAGLVMQTCRERRIVARRRRRLNGCAPSFATRPAVRRTAA